MFYVCLFLSIMPYCAASDCRSSEVAGSEHAQPFSPLLLASTSTYTHTINSGKQAQGFDLSGAIMAEAKFQKVNFKEAVMSKAYAKASARYCVSLHLSLIYAHTHLSCTYGNPKAFLSFPSNENK